LVQIEKKAPHRTYQHEVCGENHIAGDELAVVVPRETETVTVRLEIPILSSVCQLSD